MGEIIKLFTLTKTKEPWYIKKVFWITWLEQKFVYVAGKPLLEKDFLWSGLELFSWGWILKSEVILSKTDSLKLLICQWVLDFFNIGSEEKWIRYLVIVYLEL